jgi:predicted permease
VALIAFAGLGAEIFVWTLGLRTLTGGRLDLASLKRLLSRPMIALSAALLVIWLKDVFAVREWVLAPKGAVQQGLNTLLDTCHLFGGATVPVSAVVCGCRMAAIRPHHIWTPLMGWTALLRLVLIPAIAIAILKLLPLTGLPLNVLMVIAVQPVAMVSVTLAELYDKDPPFAAAVVFVTHVACLVTVPLWLNFVL